MKTTINAINNMHYTLIDSAKAFFGSFDAAYVNKFEQQPEGPWANGFISKYINTFIIRDRMKLLIT
jgi:hypothetical protein